MTRIYRYVLMTDIGMAPHVKRGIVSLATCKPQIRQTAREGDWIIGCFPAPHNERIAWAGVVQRRMPVGQYGIEFADRDDALYPYRCGEPTRRLNKMRWYHRNEDNERKDKKANALIFDPEQTWYFGSDGPPLPPNLEHLAARGIGHRVNGTRIGDVDRLAAWLRRQTPGIHGAPRHGWYGPDSPKCSPRITPPTRPLAPQRRSPPC